MEVEPGRTVAAGAEPVRACVPRWRQIEIMRERAALREALCGIDADLEGFDELEDEVFGSEGENEELYDHSNSGKDEDIDLDDDGYEDDEFDDFDDD